MYMITAPIPDDLATVVQSYRQKYDPAANLLSPHITVINSFDFSGPMEDLTQHLSEVGETHAPIKVSLVGWDIAQQDIYRLRIPILAGRQEFTALRDHLLTGPLNHLNQADTPYWANVPMGLLPTETDVENAKKQLKSFEPQYIFRVTYLTLLQQDGPSQPWQTQEKIALEATMTSPRRRRTPSRPLNIKSINK